MMDRFSAKKRKTVTVSFALNVVAIEVLYLVDVRMPVFIVYRLSRFVGNSREKRWLRQIDRSGINAKPFTDCFHNSRFDFLKYTHRTGL